MIGDVSKAEKCKALTLHGSLVGSCLTVIWQRSALSAKWFVLI